jgi:ACS family tartrate transporter-like MFS transporter
MQQTALSSALPHPEGSTMAAAAAIETRTIRKISWRLLPLIVFAYLVAYIDRTNVAFAALTMNKDIGLSAYIYGWGAGIFFIGYFFFEVPSNLILHKFGARKWIARIMITWGIVSALMALVTGPVSFLVMRFLLGVAEAGFFPGVILYFTYWFPSVYRARVISTLFLAVPVSNAVASMMSGAILTSMNGVLGLKGWQWVFIIEALPAILLAFAVLKLLTDRPEVATWLAPEEREWLSNRMADEQRKIAATGRRMTLLQALTDRRVLGLCLMYLATVTSNYGLSFFLPQIVKGLGRSNLVTGFLSAIPFAVGTIGLLAWGFSSDRHHERKWHMISACLFATVGLAGAAWVGNSYWALVFMSIATMGIYGSRPAFWPMPSTFLTGTSAAGAIALINSVGNLGGYLGPFMVGWGKDVTGRFNAGLYFLAGMILLGAVITFFAAPAETRREEPALALPEPAVSGGGR